MKKNSILIVDDDTTSLTALMHILDEDYTVYAEKNGESCLDTAKSLMPDLILLDVMMPGITGFEVIRLLKKDDAVKDIPVLFITGKNNPGDEVKGFALGAADYIAKPYHTQVVKMRVQHQMRIINHARKIERMKESEEKSNLPWELISAASGIAHWDVDVDWDLGLLSPYSEVRWKKSFIAMLGLKGEHINERGETVNDFPDILKSWTDLMHPDHAEQTGEEILAHMTDPTGETKYDSTYLVKVKLPDGNFEWQWFRATGTTFFDAEGKAVKIAGTFENVDKAVKLNEAAERTRLEEEYRSFLGATENIIGNLLNSIVDDSSFDNVMSLVMQKAAEALNVSAVFVMEDDTVAKVPPMRTFNSVEERMIERVRTMLVSCHMRNKLHVQMKEACERADMANAAKGVFLARMSHEIRTPISAVMGISEIQLRGKETPPGIEEAFVKIYESSKTLLNIVNGILDFSKIEAGKMPLSNSEYDVASLVNDAAQLQLPFLEHKDILFKLQVNPTTPTKLEGDALRIRQIISNLLSNAFKYTDEGEVEMSLEYIDGSLTVSIKDTGTGLSDTQLKEVKNEYVRLPKHENSFVNGTGLGLSIVSSLVQMMDGKLEFISCVGKGTTAIVKIPQKALGSEVLGEDVVSNLQRFEFGAWSTSKELEFVPEPMPYGKVLVVDDIDTNLYVAEAMLEAFDISVDLCESAQEAIDKIKQGKTYDVIFMDHMMPKIDGVEATKTLRDMGYNLPIVVLTANVIKGQAEFFMENGFSGFMAKPIDIKLLSSYLVRFVKGRR